MTKRLRRPTVGGESAAALIRILSRMQRKKLPNGWFEMEGEWSADESKVIVPALMRIEADLLRRDAKRVAAGHPEPRTADQRRADAFVALVVRVSRVAQDELARRRANRAS